MPNEEEDSAAIPVWGTPVEHEEAMKAFCKVARYWQDHGAADQVRCMPETPLVNVGEFIGEGLGFLWHFVIVRDPGETTTADKFA